MFLSSLKKKKGR